MSNIVKPVSGKTDFIKVARSVLQIEAKAVRSLMPRVAQDFVRIVELIMASAGRIIITGMGKPGIIGQRYQLLCLQPVQQVYFFILRRLYMAILAA